MRLNLKKSKSIKYAIKIDVRFVEDPEDICADLAYVASVLEGEHWTERSQELERFLGNIL